MNRYVRGFADDADAEEALRGFKRFPQWMWRNTVVVDFVGWLRAHNEATVGPEPGDGRKVGFYGMDLYSLHASIEAVLGYLDKVDRAAATRARYRYACFEHFGEDPQAYGYAAGFDLDRSCEDDVVRQLVELRLRAGEYARRDGRVAEDEYFAAEQNARLVRNAEQYYRSMFHGRVSSWNLRDSHMVETLEALVNFLDAHAPNDRRAKVVVWAHNSHLGDARATEVAEQGEHNVGQLVRQRWGERDTRLIGFSTYGGTVTVADDWDGPARQMRVNEALRDSWEDVFHDVGIGQFVLDLRQARGEALDLLRQPRLQRAIGVIYRPQTERLSHYYHARLAEQFDAMIHLDQTRALEPLERAAEEHTEEPAETYPTGV